MSSKLFATLFGDNTDIRLELVHHVLGHVALDASI